MSDAEKLNRTNQQLRIHIRAQHRQVAQKTEFAESALARKQFFANLLGVSLWAHAVTILGVLVWLVVK